MPETTQQEGEAFNSIWRLDCDASRREYTLTIEFFSDLSPARHEAAHAALKRQAAEWLLGHDLDPNQCKIQVEFKRLPRKGTAQEHAAKDEEEEALSQSEAETLSLAVEQVQVEQL